MEFVMKPDFARGHNSFSRIKKTVSNNQMPGRQDYRTEITKEESTISFGYYNH